MGTKGLTNSSVLAVVEETTEGTLKFPSAGTDFLALQPDTTLAPEIESLENEEIRASIGAAKPVPGIETPTGELSHYFRHSGVEGTAPNFGKLLEGLFGSTSSNGTERTTTVASTTSVIKLGAGGGDFARGKAILIKDGTNGYSIRPVHSVSTNDLTLGFALSAAPATGINVGKCVNYAPANSGHPAFSIIRYNGNGHSIDAAAGMKVTEMSLEVEAGGFLNAAYSFAGTKYFMDPMLVATADSKLDFNDGVDDFVATVTTKSYRTPHELAQALEDSMNAAGAAGVYTVVYNDAGASEGKFTISAVGGSLDLTWNTGANTANTIGNLLGFSVAADDTGFMTYTSDSAVSWAAGYTPSYDVADPLVGKNNEVFFGGVTDNVNFCANSISFQFSNENTPVACIGAESGVDSNFFSRREVTLTLSGVLDKNDAKYFDKFVNNTESRFLYNFGEKLGGNWVAGKCGCIYLPSCTVVSHSITDLDGVIGLELELRAFVDSNANGEVYINFL